MEKRTGFDGFRIITDEQTPKCGLLNPENEMVVPCVMDKISPFLDDTWEEDVGVPHLAPGPAPQLRSRLCTAFWTHSGPSIYKHTS